MLVQTSDCPTKGTMLSGVSKPRPVIASAADGRDTKIITGSPGRCR
jgi:hypothetical protein